ncbi:hypothetical protein SRHO_G00189480 [Serrasalmus rhombeus]
MACCYPSGRAEEPWSHAVLTAQRRQVQHPQRDGIQPKLQQNTRDTRALRRPSAVRRYQTEQLDFLIPASGEKHQQHDERHPSAPLRRNCSA